MPRAATATVAAAGGGEGSDGGSGGAINSNNKTRKSMRMAEFYKECASVCVREGVCVCVPHCIVSDESCD